MSARKLLEELRASGVDLVADGDNLRYRPKEIVTVGLLNCLRQDKPRLLKLLERERRKLEEADRRGLIMNWARKPGWLALHDPKTDEWHKVRASEYPPGIAEAASARRRQESARVRARHDRCTATSRAAHEQGD